MTAAYGTDAEGNPLAGTSPFASGTFQDSLFNVAGLPTRNIDQISDVLTKAGGASVYTPDLLAQLNSQQMSKFGNWSGNEDPSDILFKIAGLTPGTNDDAMFKQFQSSPAGQQGLQEGQMLWNSQKEPSNSWMALLPMAAPFAVAGLAAAGAAGAAAGAEGVGAAAGGGAATGGGLDALGTLVNAVPEGMTASSYATSLGYSSADEMLAAMAPAGAAAGGSSLATTGGPTSSGWDAQGVSGMEGTPAFNAASQGLGQPSFMDMLKNILGPGASNGGGILGRAATALGVPSSIASNISPLFSIGSGIYNMMQADDLKKKSAQYAAQADPFGPYRAQYAGQLSSLMADPSSVTSLPGYKAGLQAVERRGAAQGWNGSGNMAASLADFGGNFYNNAVTQLAGLAGANIGPGTGAQIGLQGATNAASIGAQSINSIGYGLTQQSNPMTDILLRLAMNRGA